MYVSGLLYGASLHFCRPQMMLQLPVHRENISTFWDLKRTEKIRTLEALANLDFRNWQHPRPIICFGLDGPLGNQFFEKLMWRCPSIVGVFDPFYSGGEITPYYFFPARHIETHENQYFKIYRTLVELKALAKAYKDLIFVDFSETGPSNFLRSYLEKEKFDVVDFTFYELIENLPSVYEPWQEYRAKTKENLDRFIELEEKLDDELSKQTLWAHLYFALSGDRTLLKSKSASPGSTYKAFRPDGFHRNDIIVDAGAAHGDTVIDCLAHSHDGAPEFVCFEPDPANFRKLKIIQKRLHTVKMKLHQKAVGKIVGETEFAPLGSVSSHVLKNANSNPGSIKVPVTTLDDSVESCTFIKMDIEGVEPDALRGAHRLFAKHRPEAAICVYHNALDLPDCIDLILAMELKYKFNLRRHSTYIYELILYANPL